ncbi:CHRD domain-containing protein [Methylococcus sp. EFPC2]|uniref:CHRD domain-containing protein n=1 Tax=Methylococcus sp. EFPC2 TaxID=2812648 RepID=UPI001968808D|nr:CHRD domain-containing protein [Methylococcus sp. EFPC2]QSA97937.1 CHRD domain-containing protein [Methylococcus sp. EFPC2]
MFKRSCLAFFLPLLLTAGGASASEIYQATLSGAAEASPNASPGTGTALVSFDEVAHTLTVDVSFAGLLAGNTAAHIHCCTAVPGTGTAGVATTTPTFTGFPTGTTSGSYTHTFDLTQDTSWNSSFITSHGGTVGGAEAALGAGLAAGQAYFNIHSSLFPGGEIRGFLTAVPLPGSLSMLGLGVSALLVLAKRRTGVLPN